MMDRCLEGSIHFLTFGFRPDVQSADFFYAPPGITVCKVKSICTYSYKHNLPRPLHVSDQLHQLHLLQVVGVTTHRKKNFSSKMFSVLSVYTSHDRSV